MLKSFPLIHIFVALVISLKTTLRQSAGETAIEGLSGAVHGRASGLSLRKKNSLNLLLAKT
jgi:hypothetical protein